MQPGSPHSNGKRAGNVKRTHAPPEPTHLHQGRAPHPQLLEGLKRLRGGPMPARCKSSHMSTHHTTNCSMVVCPALGCSPSITSLGVPFASTALRRVHMPLLLYPSLPMLRVCKYSKRPSTLPPCARARRHPPEPGWLPAHASTSGKQRQSPIRNDRSDCMLGMGESMMNGPR